MLTDLTIAIPSRSRWWWPKTVDAMHPSLWEHMVVYTPMDQVKHYRDILAKPIRVVGLEYTHIGQKRQMILEKSNTGKVIMMDDNLTFYKRTVTGATFKSMPPASMDTVDMITQICRLLNSYASIGLADKFMSQHKPRQIQEYQRFIHVLCYNLARLPTPWPQFEICHYEDHHFHLQLLEASCPTAIATEWSKTKAGKNTGGCSDWRTEALMDQAADFMLNRWPGICIDNSERGEDGARRLKFRWKQARHNALYINNR